MIYTPCLDYGVFPSLLKMSNLISIHKEESKERVSNYRPISLLPICDKIFERIYIELCSNLIENDVNYQGDSCINQLLSMKDLKFVEFY